MQEELTSDSQKWPTQAQLSIFPTQNVLSHPHKKHISTIILIFIYLIIFKLSSMFLSQVRIHCYFLCFHTNKPQSTHRGTWVLFTFSYTKHVKFIFTHATFLSIINKWHTHLVSPVSTNSLICRFLQNTKRNFKPCVVCFDRSKPWQSIFLNTNDEKLSVSFPQVLTWMFQVHVMQFGDVFCVP